MQYIAQTFVYEKIFPNGYHTCLQWNKNVFMTQHCLKPKSQDIVPSHHYLFARLKRMHKEKRFVTNEELHIYYNINLSNRKIIIPKITFVLDFYKTLT